MSWMERLRRVFAIDLSICPDCGGRLRVIADVTRPDILQRILNGRRTGRCTTTGALSLLDLLAQGKTRELLAACRDMFAFENVHV